MTHASPIREQLFVAPLFRSDLKRARGAAYDAANGLNNDPALSRIVAWARENLSESERRALAQALNGGASSASDFTLNSATAARENRSLAGPKAASPTRDGESVMSKAEQRDAIIRWLQERGISDEDVMRVAAMLGDETCAADLPEAKGAHDSARRRHYRELRAAGVSHHDAAIAADSLARVNCGVRPTPAPARASASAFAKRYPNMSHVKVDTMGTPVPPRKATFDSKAQSGFAERFPAAMKVRLGG